MLRQAENVNKTVGAGESAQDAGSTNSPELKQSTGKQLVAIIFILAVATKMFLLPIFLIQSTGRDAYIALAVGGGFDLVTLGIIIWAMYAAREYDFFTLLTSVLGKVGAKITVGILALFLFFKLNLSVAEILAFYGNNISSDFDTSIMIIVLLVFFVAAGSHTLRSLCRLNEMLVPIIVLCLGILIAIVVMTGFDLANIFPALQDANGFKTGLIRHFAWTGDFTVLVLFIGRTKLKKATGYFAAGSGFIGTAVAVFFAIVMSAAFGNVPMLVDSKTNFSSILQFSIGNVYGRIDMFSSMLWSIAVFIEAALFFYATCRCVSFVIGKDTHFIIATGVAAVMYFLQVFALTDQTVFSVVVTSWTASVITPVLALSVPVLALVCAMIARRRQRTDKA